MKPSEMFKTSSELAILAIMTVGILMFLYALSVWVLSIIGG